LRKGINIRRAASAPELSRNSGILFGYKAGEDNWEELLENPELIYQIKAMQKTINDLKAELEEAHEIGAALSAGQCIFTDDSGLVGDDYGHSICLKDQALAAANKVIRYYFDNNLVNGSRKYTLRLIKGHENYDAIKLALEAEPNQLKEPVCSICNGSGYIDAGNGNINECQCSTGEELV